MESYFVQFPWLERKEGKLFCKYCTAFPAGVHKSEVFLKGWTGTQDGFKTEMFVKHEARHSKENGAAEKYLELYEK